MNVIRMVRLFGVHALKRELGQYTNSQLRIMAIKHGLGLGVLMYSDKDKLIHTMAVRAESIANKGRVYATEI